MDKKGVSRFSVGVFCPKPPKNIVGEPFCASEMFWYQKSMDNRGITILSIFFVSHRQESSPVNQSVFQNYFCFKLLDNKGITILSIVFVSQCRKVCGEPSNDSKIRAPKKTMQKRGVQLFSREKMLVSQNRRNTWGNAFVFQKNSSTEESYG